MPPVENKQERIAEAKALAKSGNVAEALESLLSLEKACRLNLEVDGTVNASAAIIEVCFEAADWKLLNDHILIVCKRRSQMKQAIAKVVQMCFEYVKLDPCPLDYDSKIEIIETLRAVSAGKMFVENERARLTRLFAKIREDEGKTEEAADILHEIAPETLGSMEKSEKVEFILEQMRLSLARKDYIRAGLISNKINARTIAGKDFEAYKKQYYTQMIELHHHNTQYLEISKCFHALYLSGAVQADENAATLMLQRVVMFVLLAPHDNEQSDFLARIRKDRKMDNIPTCQRLAEMFSTPELITWPLADDLRALLDVNSPIWENNRSDSLVDEFHKRVIEHNIRVVSKYFSRIRCDRLAELLHLSVEDMESRLADMVSSGVLYARIDRLAGEITFKKPAAASDSLNAWVADISSLLSKVEETCHLIRKENVVHGIKG